MEEMETEMETTQASPFRGHLCLGHLCLGRLADRVPVRCPRLEHGLCPWAYSSSLTVVALWREEDLVASIEEQARPCPLAMTVGEDGDRGDAERCFSSCPRVPFL